MPADAAVVVAPTKALTCKDICGYGMLALVLKADLTLSRNLDFDKSVPDFLQMSGLG